MYHLAVVEKNSNNTSMPVFAGIRTLQKQGNSLMLAAPKAELRDGLGIDVEECDGKRVQMVLQEDGTLTVDLSILAD